MIPTGALTVGLGRWIKIEQIIFSLNGWKMKMWRVLQPAIFHNIRICLFHLQKDNTCISIFISDNLENVSEKATFLNHSVNNQQNVTLYNISTNFKWRYACERLEWKLHLSEFENCKTLEYCTCSTDKLRNYNLCLPKKVVGDQNWEKLNQNGWTYLV